MIAKNRARRRRAWIMAGWLTLTGSVLADPIPTASAPTVPMLPAASSTQTGPAPTGQPVIQLPPGSVIQVENMPGQCPR